MSIQPKIQAGRPKLSLRRKRDTSSHSNPQPPPASSSPRKLPGLSIVLQRCTPTSSPIGINSNDVMISPEDESSEHGLNSPSTDLMKSGESRSRPQDATMKETESTVADTGLGQFFFCQICQKNLTLLNETRRTQHINRCCDEDREPLSNTCLLCKKGFKTKQVMLSHMKVCAKRKGISTNQLLSMQREEATAGSTLGSVIQEERPHPIDHPQEKKPEVRGSVPRISQLMIGDPDGDFVVPPPVAKTKRGRKRKQGEQLDCIEVIEDEQLQMALALSASMDPQTKQAAIAPCETGMKKRKRSKKDNSSEIPLLLTTTSSQAENVVAQRAGEILGTAKVDSDVDSDGDIPCTPAFGTSELAKKNPSEDDPQRHSWDELIGESEMCRPSGIGNIYCSTTVVREDVFVEDVVGSSAAANLEVEKEQNQDEERDIHNCQCLAELPDQTSVSPSHPTKSLHDLGYQTSVSPSHPTKSPHDLGYQTSVSSHPTKSPHDLGYQTSVSPSHPTKSPHDLGYQTSVSPSHPTKSPHDLGYQTLWQLSSYGELEENSDFYVPALSSIISPVKRCPVLCRVCGSDPLTGCASSCHSPTEADDAVQDSVPLDSSVHGEGTAKLIADLCTLVGSSLLSDVMITTENGTEIPAHAVVLSCRCPALREVIVESIGRPISLDFSDSDDETVFSFLRYLYTGQTPLENVWRRFTALAHRWSLYPETERSCGEEGAQVSADSKDSSIIGAHCSNREVSKEREAVVEREPEVEVDVTVEEINVSPLHESSNADPVPLDSCLCDQPILEVEDDSTSHGPLESGSSSNITIASSNVCGGSDLQPDVHSDEILVLSSPDLDQRKEEHTTISENSPPKLPDPPSSPIIFHNDSPSSKSEILISGSEANSEEIFVQSSPEEEDDVVCGITEECSFVIADWNQDTPTAVQYSALTLPEEKYTVDLTTTTKSEHFATPVPLRTAARQVAMATSLFLTPVTCDEVSATPGCSRIVLESDDNITPMPDYRTMRTPLLKGECSRFGVKQLAKTKMIAKLEEIYEYTHPLVDEDGKTIVVQKPQSKGVRKKASTAGSPTKGKPPSKKRERKQLNIDDGQIESSQHATMSCREEVGVAQLVRECVVSDEELYRDVLLYKPLELSFIHSKLKSAGITVGKEKLEDILDCLCVTYTLPRNSSSLRTSKKT